jgi:hypothetical protein
VPSDRLGAEHERTMLACLEGWRLTGIRCAFTALTAELA